MCKRSTARLIQAERDVAPGNSQSRNLEREMFEAEYV
jgi:hypothetical protein